MDDDQRHSTEAYEPGTGAEHDLDQPFVARLGLSVGALLAIFVGGSLGVLARYQLDAHHPIAQGHFPWPTLVINLSGSLAIGLLVPLTEHVAPRAPSARPLRRRRISRRVDHVLDPGGRLDVVDQGR